MNDLRSPATTTPHDFASEHDYYQEAVQRIALTSPTPPRSRLPQSQISPSRNNTVDQLPLYSPPPVTVGNPLEDIANDLDNPTHRRHTQSLSLVTDSSRYSNPLATFDQILPANSISPHARPSRPISLSHGRTESFRKFLSPGARQSTEIDTGKSQMEKEGGLPVENATIQAGPRLSDETNGAGPRARKKSGFAKFVNSMIGSPKPMISAPMNPVHITRVGYDHQTGQYTVCHHSAQLRLLQAWTT